LKSDAIARIVDEIGGGSVECRAKTNEKKIQGENTTVSQSSKIHLPSEAASSFLPHTGNSPSMRRAPKLPNADLLTPVCSLRPIVSVESPFALVRRSVSTQHIKHADVIAHRTHSKMRYLRPLRATKNSRKYFCCCIPNFHVLVTQAFDQSHYNLVDLTVRERSEIPIHENQKYR
jgi:hypothetical protein